MERRDRRELLWLSGVLAVALALRVAYILGQRGDLLFDYPVVDEETYVTMGRALADGRVPDPRPWFQPPGLVYALGAIFRVCGPGLLVPRIVQALVSAGSCALTFVVARRLFTPRVAFAAAAICAVHGALVFESYELLPPTWMLAADLLALWALLRAQERRTPREALVAGGALGVAAVFGPTVLLFAVVSAWMLRKPALVAAFVIGLALPIAPVTWGNWTRGQEIVLVSTNGGINFFIGNNEHYDETLATRPGAHWDELKGRPQRAGVVGEGAASSYFVHEALAFWREHPARALGLYARKLYLYFSGPEIPRDTDLQAMRESSALLRLLVTRGPPWVPDGLLVPLALVGAAACWPERRRLAVLYAFVALQALVVAAFFVTSRYRVPAVPVLAMFAGAGVERVASSSFRRRATAAAAFVALALALNAPTRESSVSFAAELDFYRGLASQRYLHQTARAIDYFRRATAEDPGDGRFWFELGNALDGVGRSDEALDAWRRAGEVDPWDARARRRESVVLAKRGDLDGAIAALRDDVDSRARDAAFYASDHLNLALLYARRGLDAQAIAELGAARAADPAWYRANIAGFARSVSTAPDIGPDFREAVRSQ